MVGLQVQVWQAQQRLDFRRKAKAHAGLAVIERLDAQPVARQKELARALIPQRNRKHAAQALHNLRAPFFIAMQHALRIRARTKDMPAALKFHPQSLMVIDLAIEHKPKRAGLAAHGLMPRGSQIND